jgi:hypothetical protein
MKCVEDSRYADPEKAASRLMELDHAVEPAQDGRIHIKKISRLFLFEDGSAAREELMTPSEKWDMPYIVALACLAAGLIIALAASWP